MLRARFTITILAAIGALLTASAGVGFAQGLDESDNAAQQQYGPTTDRPPSKPRPTQEVLGEIGEVEQPSRQERQPQPQPQPQVAPAQQAAPQQAAPQGAIQPVQGQAAGELPFTGFATAAIALLGLALLAGGLVLRRSTRRSQQQR